MPLSDIKIGRTGSPSDPNLLPDLYPAPPVDGHGRYHLNGESYTRCSTIAKGLDSTFLLDRWKIVQTMLGLKTPALYATLQATPDDDVKALRQLALDAQERAGATDRARLGTATHRANQHVLDGKLDLDDTPELFRLDLYAIRNTLTAMELVPMMGWVEAVVAHPERGYAGQVDMMCKSLVEGKGRHIVVDLKTGDKIDFSYDTWPIQVALYAGATHYWDRSTDRLVEFPEGFMDREKAYILHAPAGTGTAFLYRIDLPLVEPAVDLALGARKLIGFGKKALTLVHSEDPRPVRAMRAEGLRLRCQRMIEAVPACAVPLNERLKLAGVPSWPEAAASKHEYTDAELGAIEAVVIEGEAALGLPFMTREEEKALGKTLGEHLTGEPEVDPLKALAADDSLWEPLVVRHQGPRLIRNADGEWVEEPFAGLPTPDDPDPLQLGSDQARAAYAKGHSEATEATRDLAEELRREAAVQRHPAAHTHGVPVESYGTGMPALTEADIAGRKSYSGWSGYTDEDKVAAAPADPGLQVLLDAFPGSNVVPIKATASPEVARLLERVHALPSDLRAKLHAWAQAQGIVNLKSASGDHVDVVAEKVLEAEMELDERLGRLYAVVGDPEMLPSIWPHIGVGPWPDKTLLTRDQIEAIKALVIAYEDEFVQVDIDGTLFVADVTQAKKLISANHGSAAAAKVACARWAQALARPELRLGTVKAMSEHAVVASIMAFGPGIHTTDLPETTNDKEEGSNASE